MYSFAASLFAWVVVLIGFFFLFPIALVLWAITILFDSRLKWLHLFSSVWASSYTWLIPFWIVKIIDRRKIDPKQVYVMVCNHQSMLDILVLYRLFAHFKWVAKKELFKVPVVGWNMSLNRYISVDRGNKTSHIKMFKECEDNLAAGSSIMIFPEGTRSSDGEIHAFKEGAFKMALNAKVPILPIVLDGTSDLLPKHGFILKKKNTIYVKILDPIPYSSFEGTSPKDLAARLQALMSENYHQLKSTYQKR